MVMWRSKPAPLPLDIVDRGHTPFPKGIPPFLGAGRGWNLGRHTNQIGKVEADRAWTGVRAQLARNPGTAIASPGDVRSKHAGDLPVSHTHVCADQGHRTAGISQNRYAAPQPPIDGVGAARIPNPIDHFMSSGGCHSQGCPGLTPGGTARFQTAFPASSMPRQCDGAPAMRNRGLGAGS